MAGQMKMDLHDLAEGLPADFDKLPALATETHSLFALLDHLRSHLRVREQQDSQPWPQPSNPSKGLAV